MQKTNDRNKRWAVLSIFLLLITAVSGFTLSVSHHFPVNRTEALNNEIQADNSGSSTEKTSTAQLQINSNKK